MSDFSYIHIALRGEVQGATRTIYSYPSAGSHIDPAWSTSMVEPPVAMKRFLNATECYVIQNSPLGNYISLITSNTLHPEQGYMMISILVENSCSLTGRQVMAAFNHLKKTLIEDEDRSDRAVDQALASAGIPVEPVRLESWTYTPSEKAPVAEAAYRTFISVQELEAIFTFPGQPDYSDYRCILVVSATTSLRPGAKMPRITTSIRKQYSISCPDGVTASEKLAYDGDRVTLTYSKEGFDSHTETIVAGSPTAYTKYEGSIINIRTASQTGIRFVRRIPVRVISANEATIKGYTVSVNGRSVSTMDPFIDFTEKDLTAGTEVDIQVASNNYRPLRLKHKAEEILATSELKLELQPVEQGVILRLDFGDGRVFEQNIFIKKNTPEYNRLHSGNFHGFRANRQVTGDDSEVYNVDVRASAKPETSGPDGQEQPQDKPHTSAPKFENISEDEPDTRPLFDASRPTSGLSEEDTTTEGEPNEVSPTSKRKSRKKIIYTAAAVIAAIIIAGSAWIFLTPAGDSGIDADMPIAGEATDETPLTETPPLVLPMTPDEQVDTDYLNSTNVWELDRLKSPMGLRLAKAITDGNLNAFASNDYFAVSGRCSNKQAIEAVEMAWKAIGSRSAHSNARKLRASAKNGSVDLRELVNSLARVRPAEGINSTPRPKK